MKKGIEKRVEELMNMPQNKLPFMCLEYCKNLSSRIGLCGEVWMTVFYTYAQIVEGYICKNDSYIPTPEEINIFNGILRENKYMNIIPPPIAEEKIEIEVENKEKIEIGKNDDEGNYWERHIDREELENKLYNAINNVNKEIKNGNDYGNGYHYNRGKLDTLTQVRDLIKYWM